MPSVLFPSTPGSVPSLPTSCCSHRDTSRIDRLPPFKHVATLPQKPPSLGPKGLLAGCPAPDGPAGEAPPRNQRRPDVPGPRGTRPRPVGRWALSVVQVSPGSREGQGTALLGAHLSARQPVHCLFFEGFYGPALPRGERNPGETSVPASQGGLGLYTCSTERMVPVQSHKEMGTEMGPRSSVSAPGPESPVTRGESRTRWVLPPGSGTARPGTGWTTTVPTGPFFPAGNTAKYLIQSPH